MDFYDTIKPMWKDNGDDMPTKHLQGIAPSWEEQNVMGDPNAFTETIEQTETIHFPATYAGMSQRASGEIVVKFELDASQLAMVQKLGGEWMDKGLLVAITTSDEETIAG